MCGIVGFVAADPTKHGRRRMSVLSQGLFVDSLRGMGGTGVACVMKNGDVSVYKRALAGPDYLNSMAWELGTRDAENARIAIGHNRAATIGSIKDKNCHPFHYSTKREVVLVHNGTLNSYYGLTKGFNHEVDSAYVAYALSEADDPMDVLKKLKGAFVLVWWDKTAGTFNIARNSFRDISYIQDKDGDFYFASEHNMLNWLCDRNGIEFAWKNYKSPADDSWCEWKFDDQGKLGKPVTRKIEYEKERVYYAERGGPWNVYDTDKGKYKDALEEAGFSRDEQVYVELIRFSEYPNSRNGMGHAEAYLVFGSDGLKSYGYEDAIEVKIHSITKAEWEKWNGNYGNFFPVLLTSATATYKYAEKEVVLNARPDRDALREWDETGPKTSPNGDYVPGPGKVLIAHSRWKELTAAGCANCTNPVRDADHDKIRWVTGAEPPAPLCHICSNDTQLLLTLDPNSEKSPNKKAS